MITFLRQVNFFNRNWTVIGASLAMAAVIPAPSDAASDAVVHDAMRSVVAIYRANASKPIGTGFIITPDGYILTASHVVDQNSDQYKGATFRVRLESNTSSIDARLVAQSEYLDVALLKIIPPNDPSSLSEVKPLPLKERSADKDFTILGNPSETRPKLFDQTNVTVSDPDRIGLKVVTPDAEAGNSGGPVIDGNGFAVGIALQKSDSTSVSFVRMIDTLREFLESNEILYDVHGHGQHVSLSSFAPTDRVEKLEVLLNQLKEEEAQKDRLVADVQQQLWRLKSQVQWKLTVCEEEARLPSADDNGVPSSNVDAQAPNAQRHRLTIAYDKGNNIEIMFDARGSFVVKIVPMITGESLSDANKREALTMTKVATFEGGAWVYNGFDEDVRAQVQAYNEGARENRKSEVDASKIRGLAISLLPPEGYKEMQYFRFRAKEVTLAGAQKCGNQQ
jgi:hypothetical protein